MPSNHLTHSGGSFKNAETSQSAPSEGEAFDGVDVHDDGAKPPVMNRGGVDLPAVYVLQRRHVEETLANAPDDAVGHDGVLTLWMNFATVAMVHRLDLRHLGRSFFPFSTRLCKSRRHRIVVRPQPEPTVMHSSAPAVLLGALLRKIGEY